VVGPRPNSEDLRRKLETLEEYLAHGWGSAMEISYEHFTEVDIRVGRVIRVEDFPKARKPSYKLWIDFGALGVKRSSAQITKLYAKEDLLGKLVVAVVNFPPKQIADFLSEVLVLGVVVNDEEVVLIGPDRAVPLGMRIL
jgi:tRNA-binding protein